MPSFAFRASLSEDAGVRAGFALTEVEMLAHLPTDHPLRAGLEEDVAMRVPSDDYADAVGNLLYALGAADKPGMPTLATRFAALLDIDWRSLFKIDELLELEAVASEYLRRRNEGSPEQDKVLAELKEMVARKPRDLMEQLLLAMDVHLAQSPFFTRDARIGSAIQLKALFTSERLPADERSYFDQRFINYLDSQPHRLGDIGWRQFEGLTAEWFSRNGYAVELGPGRNDGSIDLRLWGGDPAHGAPPTIIVQCKRQKRKIERVVVKALYADILEEKAQSGLVVTTSDISPGAAADINARAYPITAANRAQVRSWINAMRKPYAGIVGDLSTAS